MTHGALKVDQLQAYTGAHAQQLLSDAHFLREWEGLADRCPWTTVYQTPGFAHTWYRVYADEYAPLIVASRTAETLDGVILLAQNARGDVVHVGAHQAEYQGWLSTPESSARLLTGTAEQLRLMGVKELRLHMASPKLPLDSLDALQPLGMHATVRQHHRGLMRVGAGNEIESSLRKKGNRSRISRLSKHAPLELVQLNSRDELDEVFDTIIDQCDLRQGALHNSLPFRADPRKRDFYLALMDEPGLLHATVLRSGDKVVAAHLGPIDRDYVSLGIISHSPLVAAHSPGKLLLLFLGRLLGTQGFSLFDLTPGGVYKDRFADRHDAVPSITLHLSPLSYLRSRGRQVAVKSLRGASEAVGLNPREVGDTLVAAAKRVARLTPRKFAQTAAVVTKRWMHSTREFRVYTMSNAEALTLGGRGSDFSINQVGDLLQYEQTAGEPNVQRFLQLALQRLEQGEFAFTYAHEGKLLHNSWIIPRTMQGGSEFGHHVHFAQWASVLWADFTHPEARGRGLHQASIRARAWFAARQRMASLVAIGVRADNAPSRHNIEKLGFTHVGSAFLQTKLGREARWTEGDFLSLDPFAPPSADPAITTDTKTDEPRATVPALVLSMDDAPAERMEKMRRDRERSERQRVLHRVDERARRVAGDRDDGNPLDDRDTARL